MTAAQPTASAPAERSKGLRYARWTVAVIAARGIDAVLSFAVAVLLANRFGASAQLDAFFVARRATLGMTDLVRELVNKVAMPHIAPAIAAGGRVHRGMFPASVVALLAAMILIPTALFFYPQLLTDLVAPGFARDRAELATALIRILIALLPIAVFTGLLLTYLQSSGVFFVGEASKALQRLILVVVLLFFVPPMTVFGIGWTLLFGGILAAGILAAIAWRVHRRSNPSKPADVPGVTDTPKPRGRIVAALVLFLYHQLTVIVDFAFASQLPTGNIAALEYGTRLVSLLPGLVTISVSTVLYPEIVRIMHGSDIAAKAQAFHKLMRGSLFVQVPCSLILACAATGLVQLLFGHGGFDAAAQRGTIVATQYYALAAIFLMPTTLAMNAIYSDSAQSPLLPTLILTAAGLALRCGLLWGLTDRLGLAGIGIAVVLATCAMSVLSLWLSNRRFARLEIGSLSADLAVIGACGVVSAICGVAIAHTLPETNSIVGLGATAALIGLVAMAGYMLTAKILRQPDMQVFWSILKEQAVRMRKGH